MTHSRSGTGAEFLVRYEGMPEGSYGTFGKPSEELMEALGSSFVEEVYKLFTSIREGRSSFMVMSMVPSHPEFLQGQLGNTSQNYVQCAGSAEGVVVEFCCPVGAVPGEPGSWFNPEAPVGNVLYGLGRPEAADRSLVEVRWNSGRVVEVPANEVFSLEDAAVIFATYFDTGFPPGDLSRRDLGLL